MQATQLPSNGLRHRASSSKPVDVLSPPLPLDAVDPSDEELPVVPCPPVPPAAPLVDDEPGWATPPVVCTSTIDPVDASSPPPSDAVMLQPKAMTSAATQSWLRLTVWRRSFERERPTETQGVGR